jgi:hypothetical protein
VKSVAQLSSYSGRGVHPLINCSAVAVVQTAVISGSRPLINYMQAVQAWLRRARAKPSRRSPSPAAALRAAKPNQLSTKPAAVAARTSMPADTTAAVVASSSKPEETIYTGADSSERPKATTAAVARRAPKREQPSAAVAASAKVMKVKTEEPEENQRETELQNGAGESKNKNKRKADEDRERMLSKKPRRTSTASSAVAERAPPDPETVPTADLKHRTQVGTNAKGRGATLDRREDPPSLVLSESSSAEPSEASSEEACGVTEEESSEEDAEGEHRIKDEPSEEAEANMRYSGTRRQNQGETEQALAAAVAAEEERQAKYRRTLYVSVSDSDNSAEETATEVDWVLGRDQFISSIICFLGTHPDPWTKEEHWGAHGQSCPCCRAANKEFFGACEFCCQIRDLKRINRQWNNRAEEFDGKVMLPAGHSPI